MRLRPSIRACYGASVVGIISGFLMAASGAVIILQTSYVDNRVGQALWTLICFLCVSGFSVLLFSLLCCSWALRMTISLPSTVEPLNELQNHQRKENKCRCWRCPTLSLWRPKVNIRVWQPPEVVITEAWPDSEKLDLKEVVTTIIEEVKEEEDKEEEQSLEDLIMVLDAVEEAVDEDDSEAKEENQEERNQDLEAELEEELAAVAENEDNIDVIEENLEEIEETQQQLEAELEAELAVEEAELLDDAIEEESLQDVISEVQEAIEAELAVEEVEVLDDTITEENLQEDNELQEEFEAELNKELETIDKGEE